MRKDELRKLKANLSRVCCFLTVFISIISAASESVIAIEDNAKVGKPDYKADQSLKSNAKINPSTLAVELAVPLGGFMGRGETGLPIVFNYSSKVWQIYSPPQSSWQDEDNTIMTDTKPLYGRRSAAGWTSNLGVPRIDYELGVYEGTDGMPFGPFIPYDPGTSCPTCSNTPPNFALFYVKRVQVTMPDGSSHEFRKDDSLYSYGTANQTGTADLTGRFLSVDGSKMILELGASSSTLFLPDGSRYLFGQAPSSGGHVANTLVDRSGNRMQYNASTREWTDTLGRVVKDPLPLNWEPFEQAQTVEDKEVAFPGFGTGTFDVTFSWRYLKDPNGGESGLENTSENLRYTSNKYCQGNLMINVPGDYLFNNPEPTVTRVCAPGYSSAAPPFNPIVLTRITLPNGQKYELKYNVFGELSKVIYPSGAYERFQYAQIKAVQPQDISYDQANRGVTDRWVSAKGDGTDEIHWSYSATHGSGQPFKVTTTNPDNTKTEQYIYSEPGTNPQPYGFGSAKTGRSYEDRVLSSTDQLLRRKLTAYTWTGAQPGGAAGATRDLRPSKEITITFDPGDAYALAQMTETVYDTNSDPEYFAELNAKQVKTYNYVVVLATAAASADATTAAGWFSGSDLATVTEVDYLYDSNYKARNISGLVTETRVKDASGIVKSKSQLSYDESGYSLATSGTMPAAAANSWVDLTLSSQLGQTVGSKRGLPTSIRNYYDISNNLYIETHSFYDQFGNLRKVRDGRNNDTETQYSADYAFAYPTKEITPIPDATGVSGSNAAFQTTTVYDYDTSLPILITDPNGQETEMLYEDALLRPTKVIAPNGQETITAYGVPDSSGNLPANQKFVKVKTQIDTDQWKEVYTWFDGLGRTVRIQNIDSSGDVFVDTEFDSMGRVKKVSNPYRTGETIYKTESFYDDLGRVTKAKTLGDNAEVLTAYSLATSGSQIGTVVTTTDQSGRLRRTITDGLGQLKRVDEPNDSNQLGSISSPSQPTVYSYDALNNLTQVYQASATQQCGGAATCSQTREFVYDALSRLKQATNPESGTISYIYDNNGNLTKKTDARNIQTDYNYDALNRVITRNYSDSTPDVTYTYDNLTNAKGKLIKVDNGISVTAYTEFGVLGRVTKSKQTTDGVEYPEMTYVYNLSGGLTEQRYPSGRIVKNVLDNNGDLAIVQTKKNSGYGFWNYADSFNYTAAGAVSSVQLGNFRWESAQFNSRVQPTRLALGSTQSATNILKLDYEYGELQTNGGIDAAKNNGNIGKQTITVPTVGGNPGFTAIQTFTYDSLNRIKEAKENINANTTPEWRQTFKYDRFGNRSFDEPNTTTLPKNCGTTPNLTVCAADRKVLNPSINISDNRLSTADGYTFDASGHTIRDAQNRKFTYDAEGKQIKVEFVDANGNPISVIGEYFYDGDGRRVRKYVPSTGETTVFIYDVTGKLLTENSSLVESSSNAKVSYLTNDHLASPRINTDQNGAVTARHDYQPFGEEIERSTYGADTVRKQFTSYERDNEIALDFAQARYFNAGFGRFSSPDPLQASARSGQPQTWNRYTYALNNPLRFVDPDGMDVNILDEKAQALLLKTLPQEIRGKVQAAIEKGNGKLTSGALDKIKSKDENFAALKTLVDSEEITEVATASTGNYGVAFYKSTRGEQREKDIKEYMKNNPNVTREQAEAFIAADGDQSEITGYFGQTYTPNGEKDTPKSPSGNLRAVVTDQTGEGASISEEDAVVAMGHELYNHTYKFRVGDKTWLAEEGPAVDAIHERTRNNYQGGLKKDSPKNIKPKQ